MLDLIHQCIKVEDNEIIVAPISKVELKTTLFQMAHGKSLGPDCFNLAFFQNFWHVVGDDVFKI